MKVGTFNLHGFWRWFKAKVRHNLGRLKLYYKATGPLLVLVLLLKIPDAVGLAAAFSHFAWFGIPIPAFTPEVRLALSTKIEVLGTLFHAMPWYSFMLIGLGRMLVADPINYYIGKNGAKVAVSDETSRLGRLVIWLEKAAHWKILFAVGAVTFLEGFMPTVLSIPMFALNPYYYAGASGVRLRSVMAVNVIASLCFLGVIWCFGPGVALAVKHLF